MSAVSCRYQLSVVMLLVIGFFGCCCRWYSCFLLVVRCRLSISMSNADCWCAQYCFVGCSWLYCRFLGYDCQLSMAAIAHFCPFSVPTVLLKCLYKIDENCTGKSLREWWIFLAKYHQCSWSDVFVLRICDLFVCFDFIFFPSPVPCLLQRGKDFAFSKYK